MEIQGFSVKQGCKTAAEHQQEEERQRFGAAVIRAASILNGDATKLVSPSEGTFMCRIIVAEVAYAYSTSNEGLCTFLFPCQRDAATAERVGRSTRLLLCNRPFMSIASQTDLTIRGVLVAGAMMQVPLRDSYLFMDEEADNTTNEVLAVVQMTLDPILRNSECVRIRMMETIISFLKTEVSRGKHGSKQALDMTEKTLKEHPDWAVLGMAVCDGIFRTPGIFLTLNANGNPTEDSTGLTNLVQWVVNLSS